MRSVRAVVDRDDQEMTGVLRAAGNVTMGAGHVWYHGITPEDLYQFMGELSNSFHIIRTDVFFVSSVFLLLGLAFTTHKMKHF